MDARMKAVYVPAEQRSAFEQALREEKWKSGGQPHLDIADIMGVFDRLFTPGNGSVITRKG